MNVELPGGNRPPIELSRTEAKYWLYMLDEKHSIESLRAIMGCSEKTVKFHVGNILKKCGVYDRRALRAWIKGEYDRLEPGKYGRMRVKR